MRRARAAPSSRLRRGTRARCGSARASSAGRSGGTRRPCSPSVTSSRTTARSDAITGVPTAIDSRIFSGQHPWSTLRAQSVSGASEATAWASQAAMSRWGTLKCQSMRSVDPETFGQAAVGRARFGGVAGADDQAEVVEIGQTGRTRRAACRRPATVAARRRRRRSDRAPPCGRGGTVSGIRAPLRITVSIGAVDPECDEPVARAPPTASPRRSACARQVDPPARRIFVSVDAPMAG